MDKYGTKDKINLTPPVIILNANAANKLIEKSKLTHWTFKRGTYTLPTRNAL